MLSDNQHIDDFFRKKEEAFAPDNLPVEANWQQFKTQHNKPGGDPDKRSPGNTHITRLLGLLVVAAVVLLIAINPFRHGKKKTTATVKQQTTVANKTIPRVRTGISSDSTPEQYFDLAGSFEGGPPHPTEVPDEVEVPIAPSEDYGPIDTIVPIPPPDEKPDATKLLQSFFQQLENPAQEFYINTERDTTLVAAAGTRLFVPAHTLINKAGPVKIILREYYKYEDIIAAKLTTTSNGEQLITGGMLHISAEQDGQPVVIVPQKSITVSMPTAHYDSRMQLFTGKEQLSTPTIDWQAAEPFHQSNDIPSRTVRTINLQTVQPVSVSYGKKTTAKFFVNANIDMPKAEIIAQLKQRFGSYYDNIKIKRVRTNKANRHAINGEQLVIDLVNMDPNKIRLAATDTLPYSAGNVKVIKKDTFNYTKKELQQSQYNFVISNMGWINCDCYRNAPHPRTDLQVNLGNEMNFTSCSAQLVYSRYQSVVSPYYGYGHTIQFRFLPTGDQAVLVLVAVKNGELVSSFVPLTISGKEIADLPFEPTTPTAFKQKLQSLFASQKQ